MGSRNKKLLRVRGSMRAPMHPLAIILTAALRGLGQYDHWGLNKASEVFLISTTQLYQYFSVYFLFAPFSEEPEVFLPKYSQTAMLLTSGG